MEYRSSRRSCRWPCCTNRRVSAAGWAPCGFSVGRGRLSLACQTDAHHPSRWSTCATSRQSVPTHRKVKLVDCTTADITNIMSHDEGVHCQPKLKSTVCDKCNTSKRKDQLVLLLKVSRPFGRSVDKTQFKVYLIVGQLRLWFVEIIITALSHHSLFSHAYLECLQSITCFTGSDSINIGSTLQRYRECETERER